MFMMRVLDIGPIDKLRTGDWETTAPGPNDEPVRAVNGLPHHADSEVLDELVADYASMYLNNAIEAWPYGIGVDRRGKP